MQVGASKHSYSLQFSDGVRRHRLRRELKGLDFPKYAGVLCVTTHLGTGLKLQSGSGPEQRCTIEASRLQPNEQKTNPRGGKRKATAGNQTRSSDHNLIQMDAKEI